MGYHCHILTMAKHSPLKSLQHYIFSYLVRVHDDGDDGDDDDPNVHATTSPDGQSHPSPSLVPLPIHLISKSLKDQLPTNPYMMLKSRRLGSHDEDVVNDEQEQETVDCAVCLSSIEAWQKVRILDNCEHAFHVECVDAWMDHGRDTCPVCRAKLLRGHGHHQELPMPGIEDPWRSERMIYLFGEDCLLDDLQP